jgi:hypothetical protein
VIMHSPNTICFFCKQKADSIWLIAYNKKSAMWFDTFLVYFYFIIVLIDY